MVLCAAMMVQAQTMRVGNKFWDGYSLYTVKEIRNLRHPKGTETMYYEAHGSTESNLRHPKGTRTMLLSGRMVRRRQWEPSFI